MGRPKTGARPPLKPGRPQRRSRAVAMAPGRGHGLRAGALRDAVPLLGALGAVLYGVLRLSYLFFYLQLRATPEEVGYGYVEVLAGELIGAVELVAILSATLTIVWACLEVGRALLRGRRTKARQAGKALRRGWWPRTALRTAAASTLLVLVGLPILAWNAGADAAQGFTVRNVYLLGTTRLPILAVQAVPARITWVVPVSGSAASMGDRQCLLYLGRSAGVVVFFDVSTRESVRVPSDGVAVSLQNTTAVPQGC